MMMLLHHSTVCISSNQTALDSRLSNQAELAPFGCICKQETLWLFQRKIKINVTKSLVQKIYIEASILFSESVQLTDRQRCWKNVDWVIICTDDLRLAQIYWNILQPTAVRDQQSFFHSEHSNYSQIFNLHTIFAAYFKEIQQFYQLLTNQFWWNNIIQKVITELNPKFGTSYNVLDSLQPYTRVVQGRKFAMFVLRNNLLITINRDTISFLALSSPREFQTSLVLSCYSSTAGRTAVKGAIICFPPDSSHLSHPTDFLKNTYIHILTHLLFYCLLLYYLLSSQSHFQTHILLETYNLCLSSFPISMGFVLCACQFFSSVNLLPQFSVITCILVSLFLSAIFLCFCSLIQISQQKPIHNRQV